MADIIRKTRSVCPVCLENISAQLTRDNDGRVYLEKECDKHGQFRVPIWRGKMDFESWVQYSTPLEGRDGCSCPQNCGICPEHEVESCCVLLEVTRRCNLRCKFCFAEGGGEESDLSLEVLKESIDDIVRQCGQPLLQLSGGEPTLRDDLPELVRYAKEAGCSYVQINTNGIRLAEDENFAKKLAEAGNDIIFLQFDGTTDEIYEALRGKPMLETKLKAIEVCSNLRMGVTLVPTVVRGINDQNLGELITLAKSLVPGVSGIHFQPVSYFGRYPDIPEEEQRYTLDQLMCDISDQASIPMESFMPSRCDHPLCGFHGNYLVTPAKELRPLSSITHSAKSRGCAKDNREYVARNWKRAPEETRPENIFDEEMDFDAFLYCIRHSSLTLSAMAFQDAMNLNIERLHRCSLHVYSDGKVKPFCANYLTSMGEV